AIILDYVVLVRQLHYCYLFFFFSSRRRHTRWPRDWSSDVCSSHLADSGRGFLSAATDWPAPSVSALPLAYPPAGAAFRAKEAGRSEERRVGKECRGGWGWGACREERGELRSRGCSDGKESDTTWFV